MTPLFDVEVAHDPSAPFPTYEKPLRYGKLPEIHHIFKEDATTPPKAISLIFAAAVVGTIPGLFVWVGFHFSFLSPFSPETCGSMVWSSREFHGYERAFY